MIVTSVCMIQSVFNARQSNTLLTFQHHPQSGGGGVDATCHTQTKCFLLIIILHKKNNDPAYHE